MYATLSDVPPVLLAYALGRWIAIAEIEVNAQSGREHSVELHQQAAAALRLFCESQADPGASVDLAVAVDALGCSIRNAWGKNATLGPASDAVLLGALRNLFA